MRYMNLIAAVDKNWAIGRNNKLLVSIPDDMKFFRETTTGKIVVMGRKTLESFPGKKPLKNRVNIVLTSDHSYQVDGAVIVHDMDELHEELIDAGCAISGCGPAFVDLFLEALADGGVECGLPRDKALLYAAQMVLVKLLAEVVRLIEEKGYEIGNVDATVIAQRPKLLNYIPTMKENISKTLKVDPDQVNVKATTEEHLGFTGEGLGISAQAVCLLNETK